MSGTPTPESSSSPEAVRVRFHPSGREVEIPPGTLVFDAVRQAGLPLGSSCDGDGLCAWCRVEVLEGLQNLSSPTPEETRLLARRRSTPEERIACLARIDGPVTLTTPYW